MAKPGPGQSRHAAAVSSGGSPLGGIESMNQLDFVHGVCFFSGNGAPPKLVNGALPDVGDLWFRVDGAVGSLIYRSTVPASGTWVVVL